MKRHTGQTARSSWATSIMKWSVFAANRVQLIKENSNIKQWKYISSKDNPADDGSGGFDSTKVNKVT